MSPRSAVTVPVNESDESPPVTVTVLDSREIPPPSRARPDSSTAANRLRRSQLRVDRDRVVTATGRGRGPSRSRSETRRRTAQRWSRLRRRGRGQLRALDAGGASQHQVVAPLDVPPSSDTGVPARRAHPGCRGPASTPRRDQERNSHADTRSYHASAYLMNLPPEVRQRATTLRLPRPPCTRSPIRAARGVLVSVPVPRPCTSATGDHVRTQSSARRATDDDRCGAAARS